MPRDIQDYKKAGYIVHPRPAKSWVSRCGRLYGKMHRWYLRLIKWHKKEGS